MYREMYSSDDLINCAEEVVFEELHKIIQRKEMSFCHCDICVVDIAAVALNNVPAAYWGNRFERYRTKTEAQEASMEKLHQQVAKEVVKAIELVNKSPHH